MKSESGIMLVAFDGSQSAMAALEWAKDKAAPLDLSIEVVNVWEYAESSLDVAGVAFGSAGYVGESDPKIWSDQILKEGVREVFLNGSQLPKLTSVEGGTVKTLVEMSRGAQLLVMGSRGHSKFTDLLLGSVSESLSAKSKCPVVIVHPHS